METGNITTSATFNIQLLVLCDSAFLIIFMRQTLTNDFWGLRKNANCAFPLNINIQGVISTYIRYLVHLKVCL